MIRFKTVTKYYDYIINIIGRSKHTSDWQSVKFEFISKKQGFISADPLKFNDGSTLRFSEHVIINENDITEIAKYSYHYEACPGPYFFRYDRDPEHKKPVVHEECHLHVNSRGPRFKTHPTNFTEVFDFIVLSFLDEK